MRFGTVRTSVIASIALALALASSSVPAHAVSKEIIELQTQVQQLMDMMQRMQSTLDAKFGVLQNMTEQTADTANQMTAAVAALKKDVDAQDQALSGKTDTVSGQMQSLNDSVDELKTRIAKLDSLIQNLQTQLGQLQSQPAGLSGAAPSATPGAAPGATPGSAPSGQTPAGGQPSGGSSTGPAASSMLSSAAQAPPLQDTYQSALRDFNAGRYSVAASEFQDVVHYYPLDDLAGSAWFYLGEIAYQKQNYDEAINDYNDVLEGFSGNARAPAAQLHKSFALLKLNKREAGIRELRSLLKRYPQTPAARAARSRLNGMGVRITP